jgi:hypothetical protein
VHEAASADAFLLKLAADGSFVWVRILAGPAGSAEPSPAAVAAGSDGALVSVGTFSGRVDFDPGPGTDLREATPSPTLGIAASLHAFKLSGAGTLAWARTFDGALNARTVAVHPSGAVWIGGAFSGTADFDPGAAVDARTAVEMLDAFALRLGADGSALGGLTIQLGMGEYIQSIAFDADGSTYLGGHADGSAAQEYFIRKLGPTGAALWSKTTPALRLLGAAPGGGFLAGGVDVRGSAASAAVLARKHDGGGAPVWTSPSPLLELTSSRPNLVAVDATRLVLFGYADRGGDFDPGAGTDVVDWGGLFISRYAF